MSETNLSDLPDRSQDYLKVIWDICERTGEPAALKDVAAQTGQKTSTASEAVRRLTDRGLVSHRPYAGMTLTGEGTRLALGMMRRHRLLEMFLCTTLGYTWDEVHEEADVLEHSVSDKLIERIDAHLGHPVRDPHGDPIPDVDGEMVGHVSESLSGVEEGGSVTVDRVSDRDPELLRYLADHGIRPGAGLTVLPAPFPGMSVVRVDRPSGPRGSDAPVDVPMTAAGIAAIHVTRD
ncbi:metal-dependent transcriptional regulator [Corynebacterium pygosceleis]|uniref:Diphtheria toxin repressor n=1 Tax=Corynebacterium pygosceleis TaxID=2800406 RepID=A0A9Q4C8H8_9CORY|nr:metal-dependent transcriptional regulator [Corynebacterium pygosceleis]MCK7637613.1 metal-dependent transcriptional regulator [Corynebacterium pygosceleis]MCK7674804.1 metal-dependent transcriptional regulator [Corynebacterium pygosceleis]MCL0119607.1 metal-dependent transcriptional regulator [Corynebacterium pygosceleis]MCX7468058.1 metal-dependent transcriptional regulator [Corynebacterium pygosceleis]